MWALVSERAKTECQPRQCGHAAAWALGRNGPMVRPSNPLPRPLEIGVILPLSCQRDVPNVPPFLKAALVSTAGEVQKLQHLDFFI
jgi:hypothetical protein